LGWRFSEKSTDWRFISAVEGFIIIIFFSSALLHLSVAIDDDEAKLMDGKMGRSGLA
jgi:hypothetical protein